ncbi:MAG: hypothetical protein QOG46_1777, partial [Pseudonocardiales bacterium]|nr:hypothetical protein [Pseudonocardiales bacterium]
MVIDLLTVVAITLLTALSTLNTAVASSGGTVVVVWITSLALSLPLALRRRRPVPVFGVVLAVAIVAVLLGMSVSVTMLPIAVALYSVALLVRPLRSATATGIALLGITLSAVLATVLDPSWRVVTPKPQYADLLSALISSWLTIGAGWTLGRSARARRRYADQLAEHRARQAVSEERLRIAREMHDVVAHSIGVIVMKAAVANHVYDTRPQESREALGVIESVGRAALTDIQRVLGSLRSAEDA